MRVAALGARHVHRVRKRVQRHVATEELGINVVISQVRAALIAPSNVGGERRGQQKDAPWREMSAKGIARSMACTHLKNVAASASRSSSCSMVRSTWAGV